MLVDQLAAIVAGLNHTPRDGHRTQRRNDVERARRLRPAGHHGGGNSEQGRDDGDKLRALGPFLVLFKHAFDGRRFLDHFAFTFAGLHRRHATDSPHAEAHGGNQR